MSTFDESKHNRHRGRFAPKPADPGLRASAPAPGSNVGMGAVDVIADAGGPAERCAAALESADTAARAWFVENESAIPADVAARFAADKDPVVRHALALRWDVSVPTSLLDDPDPLVAFAAAQRPDCTVDESARVLARADVARLARLVTV